MLFSQTKNIKFNLPTYIINGAELGFELSNQKGSTAHEFSVFFLKAHSFDSGDNYNQLGFEYKLKNYLFNDRALNGFYIAAPTVNYSSYKREYKNFNEEIKSAGIGALLGYQFFLLPISNHNLTLDINLGGNIQFPYKTNLDKDSGLVLVPKYLRFNIAVGYAF
jgi:hypothetical protein